MDIRKKARRSSLSVRAAGASGRNVVRKRLWHSSVGPLQLGLDKVAEVLSGALSGNFSEPATKLRVVQKYKAPAPDRVRKVFTPSPKPTLGIITRPDAMQDQFQRSSL